jgi:UDP-glucose 4-epimerase
VALDNLVDLIITCIHHHAAAGEVFLVSDGEDVSTRQLLEKTARALGTRAWLVPVPPGVLRQLGRIFGKGDLIDRLFGNLQVDISKARSRLGWNPPLSMDQALAKLERMGSDKANDA